MKTATTLELLRLVAALDFRPFDETDRQLYLDADEDALVGSPKAYPTRFAEALVEVTGKAISTEGGDVAEIVLSGDSVEIYATTPDFETVCVRISVDGSAL